MATDRNFAKIGNQRLEPAFAMTQPDLLQVNLHNPRQADWETHFAWSADFQQVIGISTPPDR